ncbi:MAG TPA: tetrahydrofolate dehydrogenase/cyclohydrolase catalytic domain-containing protein [Trueperaceae bacterium]
MRGKEVSDVVMRELSETVRALPYAPRLEMIRVGEDPASVIYGRGKTRAAEAIGVRSSLRVLPEGASQDELMALVETLNADPDVDGILLQLPLPGELEPEPILQAIDPDKDVDGLHTVNIGRLWSGQKGLLPCTPAGLIRILDHYQVPIAGRRAVVVGRSNLVGKPAAGLLLRRNATVSIAHSRTPDLPGLARQADILVSAVGRPGLIEPGMVQPGAAVLDVGLTRVAGKIHGDVRPDVADVAGYLTPMPGGTGVMTVTMLMQNTVDAAVARRGRA